MHSLLTLPLARDLKAAGLIWTPAPFDFFAVPDRNMDDKVFVISDILVTLEKVQEQTLFTFQGSMEWALDHVTAIDAVWLPTEAQLREALEWRLMAEEQPALSLVSGTEGCRCEIRFRGQAYGFEAPGASEAYGLALLYILHNTNPGYLH